jgi:hypothetical protein
MVVVKGLLSVFFCLFPSYSFLKYIYLLSPTEIYRSMDHRLSLSVRVCVRGCTAVAW